MVSRRFWSFLTRWGHREWCSQDLNDEMSILWPQMANFDIFGPILTNLEDLKIAHRRPQKTPKGANKVSKRPETWSRIEIFRNFCNLLHLGPRKTIVMILVGGFFTRLAKTPGFLPISHLT